MELVPGTTEYLFLLALLFGLVVSIFPRALLKVLREPSYWLSAVVFSVSWWLLELIGLHLRVWEYPPQHLLGIIILGIPLEEFAFFYLFHLGAVTCLIHYNDS